MGKISSYDKGEFIYREGTLPVRAGLILEGSVHIIKEDFWGNRSILSEVGKAGMFGKHIAALAARALASVWRRQRIASASFWIFKKCWLW